MRPKLNICKVWDADYPWDVRVEKVASTLTSRGCSVHLAARNTSRLPILEHRPEATVRRLRPWTWLPEAADTMAMFPVFANPRWLRHIRNVARESNANIILCRDLPLAPACIAVGRALQLPVVLDMAENYPAMLASMRSTGRTRMFDLLVRNPRLARWVERWTLKRVDGVMVVVDESADRLAADGVPRERIAVVSNTPPLDRVKTTPAEHRGGTTTRVVYLGLIEAQRGIGTLIDALAILRREQREVQLTLYGDGVDFAFFRERAATLGLSAPHVEFRGRVPNAEALAALNSAHVGVVPHWRDESWNTTVPNKLFDYMASGLAVLTSDTAPCARIVQTSNAGLVYHDRDAADLAAKLRMLEDPELRAQSGACGRAAISRSYHWERDADRMQALLERAAFRSP